MVSEGNNIGSEKTNGRDEKERNNGRDEKERDNGRDEKERNNGRDEKERDGNEENAKTKKTSVDNTTNADKTNNTPGIDNTNHTPDVDDKEYEIEAIEGITAENSNQKLVMRTSQEAKTKENGDNEIGEAVYLRVYDLSRGMAKVMSQQILGFQVDGIWHTSIEIFGEELYFQQGLVRQQAGTTHYGPCVRRIKLGHTECGKELLEEFFESSRSTWRHDVYDLLDNNCNHFSDYLAHFLLERGIPKDILDLPEKVKKSPAFQHLFGNSKGSGL